MKLPVLLACALLPVAVLQGLAVHAQDVSGWLPRNADAAMAAPPVTIERKIFGSGQPEAPGYENATLVQNDIYHAPQYMPGYPTAASIWARVIDVACRRDADALRCTGYNWSRALGRGEYLYFRPMMVAAVAPATAAAEEPPPPAVTSPAGAGPAPPPPKPYRN